MLMYSIVERVERLGELDNTIVVVAGDHGENLGDNGEIGKGMPWHASVSTPLFISGPGMAQGRVYHGPVTTLDLGGTWLDYGGAFGALKPEMTTTSLRPFLQGHDDNTFLANNGVGARQLKYRPHVSSGYSGNNSQGGHWRMVVKELPTSPEDPTITSYKLICCGGNGQPCKGTPKGAPVFKPPFTLYLYDTIRDPDDLLPIMDRPDLGEELLPLLPPGWCR